MTAVVCAPAAKLRTVLQNRLRVTPAVRNMNRIKKMLFQIFLYLPNNTRTVQIKLSLHIYKAPKFIHLLSKLKVSPPHIFCTVSFFFFSLTSAIFPQAGSFFYKSNP